jgi:protein TonB
MLGAVLALLLQAEPAAPPSTTIVGPEWAKKATGEDVERVFPTRAKRREINGAATIQCGVVANGTLTNCTVLEEQPLGEGFGEAALKLAPRFRLKPMLKDGRSVEGGIVRIPLRFLGPWTR